MIVKNHLRPMAGYQVVIEAALKAGARSYFASPSPYHALLLNEGAHRFQENHGSFIQAESPAAALSMAYGAASVGALPLVTCNEQDFLSMQEVLSYACLNQKAMVIVVLANGAPGQQSNQLSFQSLRYFFSPMMGTGQPLLTLLPSSHQELWNLTGRAFSRSLERSQPVLLLMDPLLLQAVSEVRMTSHTSTFRQHKLNTLENNERLALDLEQELWDQDSNHLLSDLPESPKILWLAAGLLGHWIQNLKEPDWGTLIPQSLSPFPSKELRRQLREYPEAEVFLVEYKDTAWYRQVQSFFTDLKFRQLSLPSPPESVGLKTQLKKALEQTN